jgi:Arm DNA-binding domain/Phage integrase, N-terminal SAM-like domain
MTGTITKRFRRDGEPAWGYSFFAGRTSAGKRIQITKSGFETRKEAADALLKAIQQHRSGSGTHSRVSFSEFLNRWLEEYARHRCTPKTLERYGQLGQCAIRYLADTELQNLTAMAIESMLNNLLDSGGWKEATHPNGRPLSTRTVRHVALSTIASSQLLDGVFCRPIQWTGSFYPKLKRKRSGRWTNKV